MRKKIKLGMTLLLLIGIVVLSRKLSQLVTSDEVSVAKEIIVIDPGHGGEDPGKVGVNGALEKDVNLQIAKKVKQKLEAQGIEVVMTREEDIMQESKLNDLKKRVELIDKTKPKLVVGIHQNSFTDPSVKGAQVFYYSESEEGKLAAEILQSGLLEMDPSNTRQIKANSEFYMLKKTSSPMVIVECGFLSHSEEANSLINNEYQEQIADVICAGIVKWLDK